MIFLGCLFPKCDDIGVLSAQAQHSDALFFEFVAAAHSLQPVLGWWDRCLHIWRLDLQLFLFDVLGALTAASHWTFDCTISLYLSRTCALACGGKKGGSERLRFFL